MFEGFEGKSGESFSLRIQFVSPTEKLSIDSTWKSLSTPNKLLLHPLFAPSQLDYETS
jgi:hypothetical protein